MSTAYPWYAKQWADLQQVAASGRFGHAFLFSGRQWLGVEQLASDFARYTLCEAKARDDRPCHSCRGCTLLEAGNHPDLKILSPLEDGKAILIDQVRELGDFYTLKSHYQRGKIALICPADAMNRAAANAILKVLEEPPSDALLLLVAHRFSAIPMTVRSRCVRIPCERVDTSSAIQWLATQLPAVDQDLIGHLFSQSGGAPLKALAMANDASGDHGSEMIEAVVKLQQGRTHALSEAQAFADLPIRELLRIMISLTTQLILAKFGCNAFYDRTNATPDRGLQGLADHLNLKHLYRLLDLLFETKALLAGHSGFREVDVAEALWLGLSDAVSDVATQER